MAPKSGFYTVLDLGISGRWPRNFELLSLERNLERTLIARAQAALAVLLAVFNSYVWASGCPALEGSAEHPRFNSMPTNLQDRDNHGELDREDYMRLVRDRGQASCLDSCLIKGCSLRISALLPATLG